MATHFTYATKTAHQQQRAICGRGFRSRSEIESQAAPQSFCPKINVYVEQNRPAKTRARANENKKPKRKRRRPTHDNKNRYALKMPPRNPAKDTGALSEFASASANQASKPPRGRAPNSWASKPKPEKNKPKTVTFFIFFTVLLK